MLVDPQIARHLIRYFHHSLPIVYKIESRDLCPVEGPKKERMLYLSLLLMKL